MTKAYDDIIGLPHPTSAKHPRMSTRDRAAQFSPFAALTGHEAAIRETARLTKPRAELDEYVKAELDSMLQLIVAHLADRPQVHVTYFIADEKKAGGTYVTTVGRVRKIDELQRTITMTDGTEIPIDDLYHIESPLLSRTGEKEL